MIVVHEFAREHFRNVVREARRLGLTDELFGKLRYLAEYANRPGCYYDRETGADTKCVLVTDRAPLSFGFTMYRKEPGGEFQPWFPGGVIFHEPDHWGIHT